MKAKKVREVMVALSDYATVSENDTLATAIQRLAENRQDDNFTCKHRSVLALNKDGHVTGKISLRDILKALEPKYKHFEHPEHSGSIGLSRFGLNQTFLDSLLDNFDLWDESLEELVKKAAPIIVKEVMYKPGSGEHVDIDAPLAEAIHQFILGCHQSLLVLENDRVVGVLRLSDMFDLVADLIE
jgi:CBS domain-containing protein